jgi:hypothetical protein
MDRKALRHRAAVLSTAGSCLIWCAALPASADLVVFDLAWSGASFGNGATATGRITIDDALLANPGNNSSTTPGLVTALVVTISGASAGNGTYGLADFTDFFLNTGSLALDFTRELVGQPTGQDPWGTFQPGNTGGDFNLRGASPAPSDTDNFQLTTNGGAGDHLLLTSLRPFEGKPTIDPVDRYAWGENIGWTDWRWDPGTPGKGATIGQNFCAGFIWGENVGWIQLGTGAPADGLQYTNTAAADYGLNHDGEGNLFGLAWGENIGWITFDQSASDPPHLDLATGRFAGYAYGENIGWIDLGSNGIHFVKTTTIEGALTTQEAWRLAFFGSGDNSGDGADSNDANGNGLSNLLDFAYGFNPDGPSSSADSLEVSNPGPNGEITQLGGLTFWTDPVTGEVFMRYTRRTDYAAVGLAFTDQFSRDLNTFENATESPEVIATGTGDDGTRIEAVQLKLPLVLPDSGGKARFGRNQIQINP